MKYAVISIIAVVILATPALGDLTTKVRVSDTPGRQGDGGPFTITVLPGDPISYVGDNGALVSIPVGGQFLSFCIERREYLSLPGDYYMEIDTAADGGGVGGTPDPLDVKTAALYRQWRALASPSAATNNLYQLAMWNLEQEAVFDGGADNRWEDAATGNALTGVYQVGQGPVTTLINGVGNPSGLGNVRVMTLWQNANMTGYKQDQLVVPVPAAFLLGMLGLGAAGLKLRKYV